MIIKKTVMTSLLILSLVWQGTSLYGMLSRFVVQKSTKPLSGKVLNLMTRRGYCDSPKKETELLSAMQKDLASIKESVDWINLPKKWYESFPVKALSTSVVIFSIPGAFLGYDYGRNIMVRYFVTQDLSNAIDRHFLKQGLSNGDSKVDNTKQDGDDTSLTENP